MADFPALPLWTDAYLADTTDLTAEQHGVYLILLMLAWRRSDCALPDDMPWLRTTLKRLVGLHGNAFNAIVQPLLDRFFSRGASGEFIQKRLRKERDFLLKTSRTQSEKSRKRWADSSQNKGVSSSRGNAPTPTPIDKDSDESLSRHDSPTEIRNERLGEETRRARGTRLTADWQPGPENIAFAQSLGLDPFAVAEGFRDFWIAKPGAGGCKLDWNATWRNWCRRETKGPVPGRQRPPSVVAAFSRIVHD